MLKVTVLIENTAPEACGLDFEAGLSLYIEYEGRKILLDAGFSGNFAENAKKLGVDLSQVELGVLSHGHFDHADGFKAFFPINDRTTILCRKGAGGPQFSTRAEPFYFVGVDQELWTGYADRFRELEGVHSLCPGAWLMPDGEVDPAFCGQAKDLGYKRGENDFVPDDFRHEQSLVFETDKGLVVFNCCSHNGIVNIVRSVKKQFPGRSVYAVVGGFHLFGKGESGMNCTPEFIRSVSDALKEEGVTEVYTGHCTGLPALALLQEYFGPNCHALTTGLTFEF